MAPTPVENPLEEVRFGLVLYGGVSLAVYMSGVATEFWRMTKASRGTEVNPYADVLKTANVTATVDVISGTSAGGINGVLLAKALATGADLSVLRQFWIDAADMGRLLRPTSEPDPASLLSVDVFEAELETALQEMDSSPGRTPPLVDVLDLFVSGTRLAGRVETVTDGLGNDVKTLQYRRTFHLKYRRKGYNPADEDLGYDQCDFKPEDARMLVEISRATSAFPGAFEPKFIDPRPDNAPLFEQEPNAVPTYYSDGGVLHNRPFTETISTIFARMAVVPVRRRLVSVDPDPERFGGASAATEPELLPLLREVGTTIPRYQSIANDLRTVSERNARIDTLAGLLGQVDAMTDDPRFRDHIAAADEDEFRTWLNGQLLYHAYQSIKRDRVTRELTSRVMKACSVKEADRRYVERAIVEHAGIEGVDDPTDERVGTFFDTFDDAYRLRRVVYLIKSLNRLTSASLAAEDLAEFRPIYEQLWAQFDRLRAIPWTVFGPDAGTAARLRAEVADRDGEALVDALKKALPAVEAAYKEQIDRVRADTLSACEQIEQIGAGIQGFPEPLRPFPLVFSRFEARDMFLLPVQALSGLGEAEQIGFVRVAPEAAKYIRKQPQDKLAGDALGHFGGFLSAKWRANDILWGRLDAAEVIVRILLEGRTQEEIETCIRSVQEEIAHRELNDLANHPEADYKRYLEREYTVGSEDVASLPTGETIPMALQATGVLRNMIRRMEARSKQAGLRTAFRFVGGVIGTVLGAVRWPALALWARSSVIRGIAALVLLFSFGFGVLLIVLGALHVVALTGALWIWIAGFLALPLAWLVLLWVRSRIATRKATG